MEELIPLYALGVLEGDELREAESLLDSPGAKELLGKYEDVTSLLPYAARGASPAPELRKRLIAEIIKSAPVKPGEPASVPFFNRLSSLWLGLGGALAAAVIVLLFVWNLSLRSMLNDERALIAGQQQKIESLENLLAEKDNEFRGLETKLAGLEEITEFMEDPNIILVRLENVDPDIRAAGRVLWDKDEHDALFYSLSLPAPPPGKTYQWWVVADGTTKSVGVFRSDDDGNSVVKVDSLKKYGDNVEHFKLTLEPEGGAHTPSGKTLLAGESI